MPWKPIAEQLVIATLDGKVRKVVATAWHSDTGAVQVEWPPPSVAAPQRYSSTRRTTLNLDRYEPLDPEAFSAATTRK
ncbi:MAG TPA: hypothetical protein VN796_10560 [Acidimicrobiales bacterium]|nr:hypothetical protein [Acidimicrobiales bacterium]